MSRRRRKLALFPTGEGLPQGDDPALPGPVSGSAQPALRWPQASAWVGSTWSPAHTAHCGMTDPGRRRALNEDAFLADGRLGLFIVADGVGGRPFGGLAAGEAVSVLWEWIYRETRALGASMIGRGVTEGHEAALQIGDVVRSAMQNASRTLRTMARTEPRYAGMCTTASVVLVAGEIAVVGQVGDSRVYHARGAEVRQVTEDHTLLNLRVKQGLSIPEHARGRRSPITRALGLTDELEVDIYAVPLARGDRLLLCSDGLHEYFDRATVLRHLFRLDIRAAARAAVRHARRRGGRDNITALFVEILGPG
ncbi:protein phosphatase 2C domain-containing protein [Nannocystis pusilla]|uniref:Protein phosphatase 2C domain-containing protein n=1 Tax=Nannocystis pusilla TaxID=889268 RepID=A0A9X3ETU5_9BACT|nr:protein phosphatase 2C domain-containing protein [Nannocystis pusilla]MCY1009165.1 protein phosphatase 2C domain-containing protein [Nannocystis pusilla]